MKHVSQINAVGDISFAFNPSENNKLSIFQQVSSILKEGDLTIGNLESPLLKAGEARIGKCVLRATPEWANILSADGIGMVTLANNHMMDFGSEV